MPRSYRGGTGSVPGWGTKILHAAQRGKKRKKRKRKEKLKKKNIKKEKKPWMFWRGLNRD